MFHEAGWDEHFFTSLWYRFLWNSEIDFEVFFLKHAGKTVNLYLISGDSGTAPQSPKDFNFHIWIRELYVLKWVLMLAHGLKNSDKFNYVSKISFLKTQNKSAVISLAVTGVPILGVKATRWSGWKREIICFHCIKKIEIVLCLAMVLIPCHTEKALAIRSLLAHALDGGQRPRCGTLCSWGKRRASKYSCLGATQAVPHFCWPWARTKP